MTADAQRPRISPSGPFESTAPSGAGLNAVSLFTNPGQVNFDSGDDADLFDVSPVCTGNALRIAWNASGTLLLNAGSVPGFAFTLTVDGTEVAELDAEVGFGASAPPSSQFSVSREFWVRGLTAGAHEIVLNAAFQGATAATGSIAANSSLVAEDWTLP